MYLSGPCTVGMAIGGMQRPTPDREVFALHNALRLYERTRVRALAGQAWSILARRPRCLFSLESIRQACTVHARTYVGLRSAPLSRIRGSEGRSRDFDAGFRPLQPCIKDRWVGIAIARQMGETLAPVRLIQVSDTYAVCDGHHRISVARALGETEIEAEVTVWRVTGPLPWERAVSAPRVAHQLA